MLSPNDKRSQIRWINFGLILTILSLRTSIASAQSPTKAETQQVQANESKSDIVVISFPVQGWYLVSLPLAATDSSVSGVFPTALGVFTWDHAASRYVRPTALQTGHGYWVLMGSPTAVVISGARFSQFSGHYRVGWHLIGSLMDSVNFAKPNDTPDRSVILPIFAWDAVNQRYVSRNFIEQSYGHWMLVLQECDVIVKSSSNKIEKNALHVSATEFSQRFGMVPPPPPFVLEQKPPTTLPLRSVLFYNYPNPFSVSGNFGPSSTVIRYTLTESGRARVVVYNGLGQKIRTLVEQEQSPGTHEIIWDGRDDHGRQLVSGVYYCRLVVNGFSQAQKLLLVQ